MIDRINSDDADSTIMYNATKSGRNETTDGTSVRRLLNKISIINRTKRFYPELINHSSY